jgi:simple sugar transport system ATP-binding protein
MNEGPLLVLKEMIKRFAGLVAVKNVSFSMYPGEVVALLGDNGAGKSTLIKTISGVYQPDAGQIIWRGEPMRFASPQDARNHGIETIYQDLALCENLDASQNLFLGRELMRYRIGLPKIPDRALMLSETRKILTRLNISLPNLEAPIHLLSGGQRQAIPIARALYFQARLVIMDEPSSALGIPEQQTFRIFIRQLREQGVAVLLVSHALAEVFAVADRAVVMQHGEVVGMRPINQTSEHELLALMMGATQANESS